MVMKKITPVIKKTRVREESYEVCPHCMKEIGEKATYIDKDNYVYHSPCIVKGPIERIKPMSSEELAKALGWSNQPHESDK